MDNVNKFTSFHRLVLGIIRTLKRFYYYILMCAIQEIFYISLPFLWPWEMEIMFTEMGRTSPPKPDISFAAHQKLHQDSTAYRNYHFV